MAIYRIFPTQDSTIYSQFTEQNTGRDELLEVGGYPHAGTGYTARSLIQFHIGDINEVIERKMSNATYEANLNMYMNFASELPTGFDIKAHPITTAWQEGTGKFGDLPIQKTGCSWTASNAAGGYWGTTGGDFSNAMTGSQTFNKTTTYDIDMPVTNIVTSWYSQSMHDQNAGHFVNNGFLLKMQDEYESYISSSIRIKYYSSDTNTIYPPFLEFRWDDSTFSPGTLTQLTDSHAVININNNKGEYQDQGKVRFRLNARPQYPTRTFTTSSAYLKNYYLPSSSLWGIKDEYTEEMVVPFNSNYTKISCDSTSNFFDVYLDGLQPERFYRLLVKTELDGSDIVVDNDQIFKIIRSAKVEN